MQFVPGFRPLLGALAVVIAALSVSAAHAAPGDGLKDAAARAGTTAGGLGGSVGTLGTNLGNSLGTLSGNLGGSLNRFSDNLGIILSSAGGNYVDPTPGTVSEEGYIQVQGLARRYVLVRPAVAIAGAPVLVLLHAHGLAPERMANLTRAGRLAADYGTWVYLPEAMNGAWNDDPKNPAGGPDDVAFISQLIDSAVTEHGLDAARVYAAGYSNGGFMAERASCELSSKIAGLASIAATLRDSVSAICKPGHDMPVAMFLGTSDPIVPYNGIPSLASAVGSVAFWAKAASCTAGQTTDTALPDRDPNDGTRVSLLSYSACPAITGVRLYTITNGGHTWPGSTYSGYTLELGRTTFDIDATLELWNFLSQYALAKTTP